MIKWIKNLFNKEEQTPYRLEQWRNSSENGDTNMFDYKKSQVKFDYRKEVEKCLIEDFNRCLFEYRFTVGQKSVPGIWVYHLDKCLQHGFPMLAIKHARQFDFQLAGLSVYDENGYEHPLEKYISNHKEYKKALMQIKLEEMQKDFV